MVSIEITGLGVVCAIGCNAEEVRRSLLEGRSGIAPMHFLSSVHQEIPVGEVKLSNAEMKGMLGLDAKAEVGRTALLGAVAIRQAMAEAKPKMQGKRVALISGTTVGGMDITERHFEQMQSLRRGELSEEEREVLRLAMKHDCGSSTREMAALAGLADAEVCTVSTACSSALNAIMLGAEMLLRDEADIVIAGGSEALSKFHLNGFNALMILDKGLCRPFDKERAGLNLGEGAAFVVLQREDSLSNEQNPLAYIRGYGNRCDAYHQTASSENGEGACLAMRDALGMAGLKPSDIHYINAHGTGTLGNDASESAAIRRVFGDQIPPVSSTKGFTGHATSAAGAIETAICILALRHGFIPTNLGWKEQDEACITPTQGGQRQLTNVLCNSFGFGGNDSALVISAVPHGFPTEEKTFEPEVIDESSLISETGELDADALRTFVTAGEARRMSRLMKAATLTSGQALQEAGVTCPDAIVTATAYGMLETSEKFLSDMLEKGEAMLSPTQFMQSTHNTIGSSLAIRLKCHGYNITYSQGEDSLRWALRDARRLIVTGRARTVLVGLHDESTPTLQDIFCQLGKPMPPLLQSRSIVLGRKGEGKAPSDSFAKEENPGGEGRNI